MEQTLLPPHQPVAPEAPKMPPQKERGLFEKWRQKRQRALQGEPTPEATPEAVRPERRQFGRTILNLLRGRQSETPAVSDQNVAPTRRTAEAVQLPITPEDSPQYTRATRMRRLARLIIARVVGDANREPAFAAKNHETPLNTEPLTTAASDLSGAANTLDATITQARSAAQPKSHEAAMGMGGFDAIVPGVQEIGEVAHAAAERIDQRLRLLESTAEASRTASVAAVGLGVLAVLIAGTEYFSRKRNERDIRGDIQKNAARQEWAIEQQQSEFNRLRQAQVGDMNRNQRQEYYQQLSTFTHNQAERTRQASQELEQIIPAATKTAERQEPAPVWRPRKPEATPQPAAEAEPTPIMRVESVEHTEHQPGQQTGNAGTGFFGGGGIAVGAGPSDLTPPQKPIDPNSREARELEALRRARQKRLQSNAWLYSAALGLTLAGAVVAMVVLG